jgi:hypothetical protein
MMILDEMANMEDAQAVAPIFGLVGFILSLMVFAYWMIFFRASQATLREGYILFLGFSLEVGLIVHCFNGVGDASLNMSTVVFPALLCLVLLISDELPRPARKRVLVRTRRNGDISKQK